MKLIRGLLLPFIIIGMLFTSGCDEGISQNLPKISPVKIVYADGEVISLIMRVEYEGFTWELDVTGL